MFGGKKFEIEHALNMFAYSFVHFPADQLYNAELIEPYKETVNNCHIYLIGLMPKISLLKMRQEKKMLIASFSVLSEQYDVGLEIPQGFDLVTDEDTWFLRNQDGARIIPDVDLLLTGLGREMRGIKFEVQYIGQAFGDNGSRNAYQRLQKHETLQKIALMGIPEGYKLELLLMEIQPSNRMITVINPFADNQEESESRISNGMNKLRDTNEQERITLYEASLIRHFQPKFNKEFKNSFPSTRMKLLKDCYEKDFSAIIAEICFDNMYLHLFSDSVVPAAYHIITHYLHDDENRKMFFNK